MKFASAGYRTFQSKETIRSVDKYRLHVFKGFNKHIIVVTYLLFYKITPISLSKIIYL